MQASQQYRRVDTHEPSNGVEFNGERRPVPILWDRVVVCKGSGGGIRPMSGNQDTQAGYSMIEMLVVVGLIALSASVAVIQYRPMKEMLDADVAISEAVGQLRYARELSLAQRRDVQIDFVAPSTMQVVRINGVGDTTLMAELDLPMGFTFAMPAAASSTDTPDGFGNASAIDFGLDGVTPRTGGTFLPDGTFVDEDESLLNGTIFTMGGSATTGRAGTLSGASGRPRTYQWMVNVWEVQ